MYCEFRNANVRFELWQISNTSHLSSHFHALSELGSEMRAGVYDKNNYIKVPVWSF